MLGKRDEFGRTTCNSPDALAGRRSAVESAIRKLSAVHTRWVVATGAKVTVFTLAGTVAAGLALRNLMLSGPFSLERASIAVTSTAAIGLGMYVFVIRALRFRPTCVGLDHVLTSADDPDLINALMSVPDMYWDGGNSAKSQAIAKLAWAIECGRSLAISPQNRELLRMWVRFPNGRTVDDSTYQATGFARALSFCGVASDLAALKRTRDMQCRTTGGAPIATALGPVIAEWEKRLIEGQAPMRLLRCAVPSDEDLVRPVPGSATSESNANLPRS